MSQTISFARGTAGCAGLLFVLFSVAGGVRCQDTPESIVRMSKDPVQASVKKDFGPAFRSIETDHFKVISDSSVRNHTISAAVLERCAAEMRAKFLKADFKPVTVYLIDKGIDFERFVSKKGHDELRESYGAYIPKERTMYTHRLRTNGAECGIGTLLTLVADPALEADFPKETPAWFIGSFGALFERSRIRNGKLVYGGPAPLRGETLRTAFENGAMPTIAKLFQIPNASFYDSGGVNLATGRTVMTFILVQGEDKLAKFVTAIRQKKSGQAAIESATGMKLAEIEKKWREHVANHEIGAEWLKRAEGDKTKRFAILEEGAAKFPRFGEIRAAFGHELHSAGKSDDAIAHSKAALEDPTYFGGIEAWQTIGNAYFNRDPAKAIEAYEKAMAIQPWEEHLAPALFRNYAALLKSNGKPEEAEKVLATLERLTAEDTVSAK